MRKIDTIIVHCAATPEGKAFNAADIDRWHKANGWKGIGYHFVVLLDGTVQTGRPVTEVGGHCAGHNAHSIGVCYIGGLAADGKTPRDTRTTAQRAALLTLLRQLRRQFPTARILGHHDLNPAKACPSFDAKTEYNLL